MSRGARRRRPLPIAALAIAAVILVVGLVAVRASLGYALRGTSPEVAGKLASGDARVLANRAERRFMAATDATDRAAAVRLARRAVRRDPTAVSAIATLGLDADIAGRDRQARALFDYSRKLSRRELRTSMWFIEEAVARNDVPGALRNYDIALRTSPSAPALMYPVLNAAIADPELRAALAGLLARRPAWTGGYLFQLGHATPTAGGALELFETLARRRVPILPEALDGLIRRLAEEGKYTPSWRAFTLASPGADPRRSRDPSFAAAKPQALPWLWSLADEGSLNAYVEQRGERAALGLESVAGGSGMLARQLQLLPPGRYDLTAEIAALALAGERRPTIDLTCIEGTRVLAVPLADTDRPTRLRRGFTVPARCSAQWLAISVPANESIEGLKASISTIAITPAR